MDEEQQTTEEKAIPSTDTKESLMERELMAAATSKIDALFNGLPKLAELNRSMTELRTAGVPTADVEVGLLTFEFCIELMIAKRMWSKVTPDVVRAQILAGTVDLHFDGSTIHLRIDVPEGRFWPSAKREKDVYEPIPATETE